MSRRRSCTKINLAPCFPRIMKDDQLEIGNTHMRVSYLMIKDRIAIGDLKVKYCPTGKMLADHFTKLLQGAAFQKLRSENQGIPEKQIQIWYGK